MQAPRLATSSLKGQPLDQKIQLIVGLIIYVIVIPSQSVVIFNNFSGIVTVKILQIGLNIIFHVTICEIKETVSRSTKGRINHVLRFVGAKVPLFYS